MSHDHLNEQKDIPIDNEVLQKWKACFEKIEEEHRAAGEDIKWVMVDGFLLYWYAVSAESAWHLTVVSITSTPGCCEDARLQILPPSAA